MRGGRLMYLQGVSTRAAPGSIGATMLYGRDDEVQSVFRLIDAVGQGGATLVIRGEPGIGKSALLELARQHARAKGLTVLHATGAPSETNLPFAGLHQLVRPILTEVVGLPAPQRAALYAAFGMSDDVAPGLFLIALATLSLLADAAANSPVLIACDDAQWLDTATCDVLTFVARRLEADAIIQLIAIRDEFESPIVEAGLPELRLEPLEPTAAEALLDAYARDLPNAFRERLLAEAAGNPLAIIELPAALRAELRQEQSTPPVWLPVTARLERKPCREPSRRRARAAPRCRCRGRCHARGSVEGNGTDQRSRGGCCRSGRTCC